MAVMDGYSEWAYETRIRQINEWRRTIGEFSATSKASSEKETQTFLRSKNVYGERADGEHERVVNTKLEKMWSIIKTT